MFADRVRRVLAEKQRLEPRLYKQKLTETKQALERTLRKATTELRQIQSDCRVLEKESPKELPEIAREREWARLYLTWEAFLLSPSPSTSGDLADFHAQISDKLARQKTRLDKLRQYSVQWKESAASRHATRSSHRIGRIHKVKEILAKYEARIETEGARNYDERIAKANALAQRLSDELGALHRQTADKRAQVEANRETERKVAALEGSAARKYARAARELEAKRKERDDRRARVESGDRRLAQGRLELVELDALAETARALLASVSISHALAEEIHA